MSLNVEKAAVLLAELTELDTTIADRGPHKILPRPKETIPNFPALKARFTAIQASLAVRRKVKKATGHSLDEAGAPRAYDLEAIGVVEEIKTIPKGKDRALPTSTTIVRVGFPAGEHLWFDPADLDAIDDSLDVAKAAKAPKPPKPAGDPAP